MRILLASKHCHGGRIEMGGVQSWQKTIGAELERLGHAVVFWEHGMREPDGEFDVGVLANWRRTRGVAPRCRRVLVVSHGIIDEEAPPAGVPVVFTSEGVKQHWGGTGPVLRQPIDLGYWSPAGEPEPLLVRYSYRRGLDFLPDVARRLGLDFRHLYRVGQQEARAVMRRASCVLATGRAALEAMACGVPVVILDAREYQGALLSFSPVTQMLENYSGRGGQEATRGNVAQAVALAMRRGSLRGHVERHHDAAKVTGELLRLAFGQVLHRRRIAHTGPDGLPVEDEYT